MPKLSFGEKYKSRHYEQQYFGARALYNVSDFFGAGATERRRQNSGHQIKRQRRQHSRRRRTSQRFVDADPISIGLPGGGFAQICSEHDYAPDGTQFVGFGILPDALTYPKISDFTENKDSILEVPLVALKKK